MSYYFSKTVSAPLDEAVTQVRNALADQGFGVIADIDMTKTLRDKIGVEFKPYRILGACNPKLAYEALQVEDKVGTLRGRCNRSGRFDVRHRQPGPQISRGSSATAVTLGDRGNRLAGFRVAQNGKNQ